MRDDPLPRLRRICLVLPETRERLSHGHPAFFVREKRPFVTYHHGSDRLSFWCAAPPGFQAMLVEAEPEHFFVPPYAGVRGWVGVRLDRGVDWDEIATIVEGAYRVVAPRGLVALLDKLREPPAQA